MVDWEAEFCGVIGRICHNVSAQEALDYVAGYTMINDVSARNWVKPMAQLSGLEATQAWDQNLLGKQFPTFCPMGPAVATKDEITNSNKVSFELKLNGKVMQSANTDDLAFDLAALISFYSQFHVFRPGDVISTGSPAGVGMGRKPFVFLKPGDIVEIRADGIGTMKNLVASA
jgi:2-keto-4-pentenoate hydratase/2-oxohepta-3-ene-1,7-dioic acid hydratase in catechol pathway